MTDELAMEAGGTVRFRLAPRLRPSLVEVNGAQVTPSAGPEGWSIPTGKHGRSGSSSAMRERWLPWTSAAARLGGTSRDREKTAVSCPAGRHGCPPSMIWGYGLQGQCHGSRRIPTGDDGTIGRRGSGKGGLHGARGGRGAFPVRRPLECAGTHIRRIAPAYVFRAGSGSTVDDILRFRRGISGDFLSG